MDIRDQPIGDKEDWVSIYIQCKLQYTIYIIYTYVAFYNT